MLKQRKCDTPRRNAGSEAEEASPLQSCGRLAKEATARWQSQAQAYTLLGTLHQAEITNV